MRKKNLKNITNSRPKGLEFANFFLNFFPHTRTIFSHRRSKQFLKQNTCIKNNLTLPISPGNPLFLGTTGASFQLFRDFFLQPSELGSSKSCEIWLAYCKAPLFPEIQKNKEFFFRLIYTMAEKNPEKGSFQLWERAPNPGNQIICQTKTS